MDESRNDWIVKSKVLLASLCILSIFLGMTLGHSISSSSVSPEIRPRSVESAPPTPLNTRIAVDPYRVVNLQNDQQIDVAFTLNITHAPPINDFAIILSYNYTILHASSLDSSGNILSQIPQSSEFPTRYCLDGTPGVGGQGECTTGDGPGITSFADTSLGSGLTPNDSSGTLFTVHLKPTAIAGFAQIQIKQAIIANGTVAKLAVSTIDGYYTSIDCPKGSGNPCTPSAPDFTWFPNKPAVKGVVTFYGNLSKSSPGSSISDYFWNFGDGITTSTVHRGTNSTSTHIYLSVGNWSVTLSITDSFNIVTSITHQITTHNADVEIGISNVDVAPGTLLLLPGVIIHLTASVHNYGGVPVNDTASLILDGRELNKTSVQNLAPGSEVKITAVWDTTNYAPNAYRLDAYTPPIVNQTDTSHNLKTVWIQLILRNPGGLGMWPTGALGLAVLGSIGYGVARLRRRSIPLDSM